MISYKKMSSYSHIKAMYWCKLRIFLLSNTKSGVFVQNSTSLNGYRAFSLSPNRNWRQKWYSPVDVERMSRKELQKWCKKLRIRANSKTIQLRSDLLSFHGDILSKSTILNYPFLPLHEVVIKPSLNQLTQGAARQEKILFTYKNNDGIQSSLVDVGASGSLRLRHYQNMSHDLDETHEGVAMATGSNPVKIPSVSGILRATAPKSKLFAISYWTKKQKALLGEDGFRQKMNNIKKNGIEFHRFIHQCLVDRSLNNKGPERLQGYIESTKDVFGKLGDAIGSEQGIQHVHLGYKGRIDTLACYKRNPCIIEWKTSQKKKSSLEDCGDYAMQVVAYAGAINNDPSFGFKVKHGLIVVAYEDGAPADVHCLDLKLCRNVWEDWLLRVYQFYNKSLGE